MIVTIKHKHKCKTIAIAPAMGKGREWKVGKLIKKVPEHPNETHCLHLKTQYKDVTYLCNKADFQQLQVLCMCITGKLNEGWIDGMIEISKNKAIKKITKDAR